MAPKIDKFIKNNVLLIIICLATLFAVLKKATIWQQKDEVNKVIK
jgi:uncharacterized membrane protein affecting hemolysin expression